MTIFAIVFFALTHHCTPAAKSAQIQPRIAIDVWCKRFEDFLISSANPQMVIWGSSLILLPSEVCDVKYGGMPRPTDWQGWRERSQHYTAPVFLLECLMRKGFSNLSIYNLGIPSAVVEDDNRMLKNALRFNKRPKCVVFALNLRDFVLVPKNSNELGTPINQVIGDISAPGAELTPHRLFRSVSIRSRPHALERLADDERSSFRLSAESLVRLATAPAEKAPAPSTATPQSLGFDWQLDHTFWSGGQKIDVSPLRGAFQNRDRAFVNRQFTALAEAAKELQKRNIRFVIVEIPPPPGTWSLTPADLKKQYESSIKLVCSKYGAIWYRPERERIYQEADFTDMVHLNADGARHLFISFADFIDEKKTSLGMPKGL